LDELGLIIGNSRLHWGYFKDGKLVQHWDTSHLDHPVSDGGLPTHLFPSAIAQLLGERVWVYLVSVVPQQSQLWDHYSHKTVITLDQIPIHNIYSTLGSDRALGVYGAGETYGYPVLVIDAGTALTYTAVDSERNFLGGAILPGLRLQLKALAEQTAALPDIALPHHLPLLWAHSTPSAIASGIIYTTISGIKHYLSHWWQQFPHGIVVFTGGDARLIQHYIQQHDPVLSQKIMVDQTLMFQGIWCLMI